MEIDEQAKEFLLGNSCFKCKYLKQRLLSPSIIEEEKEKFYPHNMWIQYKCSYNDKIFKIDPKKYICENYCES